MWASMSLKCPNEGAWLAVVRVNEDGQTAILGYLSAMPDDVEQELAAIQQHWTTRETWPGDEEIQTEARIRDYVKYRDEIDPEKPCTVTRLAGDWVPTEP